MSTQTRNRLSELGVSFRKSGGCCKLPGSGIYSLPMRLDVDIIPFLQPYGQPAVSFEQTSLLKLENSEFSLTGVRKLKQVRLTMKKKDRLDIADVFEDILIKYVESCEKRS